MGKGMLRKRFRFLCEARLIACLFPERKNCAHPCTTELKLISLFLWAPEFDKKGNGQKGSVTILERRCQRGENRMRLSGYDRC